MQSKKIWLTILIVIIIIVSSTAAYIFLKNRVGPSKFTPNSVPQVVETDQPNTPKDLKVNISPNDSLSSPIKISGTVPAGWMNEGVFPIKIFDASKNLITQNQGMEVNPGSWTSGKPIEFKAEIEYETNSDTGFVVLYKDNPSGDSKNDQSYEIPVKLNQSGS
jgi:hypothetical protein